ncbi:hypothetical protein RCL_jg16228.t1 [Rhizophagus clarus]|uniref:Uncharacterized protein n=1 Tax=Rhizophagus clarus TaxID=94130 RepID=A0A8H3R4R5_9GLOM|nr:hypothetical protein RCL_jg16228.t1 [Rhizophagus clarus]
MHENELSEAQCERIIGAYLSGTKQIVIFNKTCKLNSSLNTTLHNNTVKTYLHDEGLSSYVTRKKSLLTLKQQKDMLR